MAHTPLISAHRHGNEVATLLAAEAAGTDLVELDVHLFRGRLEVRHEKTVGPIPILWDRHKRPRWNPPRLALTHVLAAADPATVLHVDLKGFRRAAAVRAAQALQGRRAVVSSRSWWLLRTFRDHEDAELIRSIGARWQLRAFRLLARYRSSGHGVAARSDLLTAEQVASWKTSGLRVYAWRVPDLATADRLASWGVDVLIVDSLELAASTRGRE